MRHGACTHCWLLNENSAEEIEGIAEGFYSTIKNQQLSILVEVGAAQVKPALRTLQLAPALPQLR
jgi:hypothetical protein